MMKTKIVRAEDAPPMTECEEGLFTKEYYKKNAGKQHVIGHVPDPEKEPVKFFMYCLPFSLHWGEEDKDESRTEV